MKKFLILLGIVGIFAAPVAAFEDEIQLGEVEQKIFGRELLKIIR